MTFDDDGPLQGAGALPRVQGAGGGGGKSGGGAASSAPDTLFSTATVRLVDLLGEGEIVGVRGGLKGVYLNDVPVQNEDDSFNFKGLTAEFRVGTPDQPYMAGYPDVQTPRNVGIKVNAATPVTVSITDTDVDRLRVTIQVPSLFLAKSDGSVRANSVSYRVQARYSGGPWVNALGDQTITGKTTSGYFRSHEIALPINPSGASAPWQVQVIRLSPDTDDFNNSQAKFTNQSDLVFYSITSIVDARFSYPHSAMVGLTAQAASFGSSVPGRTYLVDGVLMPIPSNYDPVARTYSGVWDGTFKEGFSNNPAWALNLILRNDRFGLGEFIDTAAIDKWSLYEIGRYCDVPVSDGKGGQEPRYVFNGAISTQQEAFELLQLIAQVFRGTVYWSSGTVTAAQDRPSDPVLLVTEANAIEGENGEVFAYASSGRRARHTVALVAWNDPDNLYKQTIEVVEDPDGVARYGYNPTRIDLLGCTSRGQAHRTGLWTLFTELHQTQVLTYRAGLDHAVIRPGDIIAVQDPQIANLDLSGRLKAGSTASVLVLDRAVTLASGATYTISVVMPDGNVQEREISTGAGTVSSVTLRSALLQVPDAAAVWLIAGPVEPQLFRVVSIREEEPHIYAVAALQHEPGKYATIDDGAAFEPSPITEFPNIVLPPTNLSVRESQYTELGQPKQAMTLSWLPGQAFNSIAYYVTVIRPSGATVTTRTASQSIDFLEAEVGAWTFVVTAIGLNGKSSLPAQTTYTLSGWAGQAATTVGGLSVKGGGSTFSGRSCTVVWSNLIAATVPPYPVRNVAYVFDASTQALVHREVLPAGVTEWTYDYFLNVNEGGPRRQFRVGITAYSAAGDEGPPAYLTVSNPPPAAITPVLDATSEMLIVNLPAVTDLDFAGYLVWVSETPGINPLTATPYESATSPFTLKGIPDKTYYVRAAAFDAFGKNPAELSVSAEQAKKLTILLFDPFAPAVPAKPALSTVAETGIDGSVTSTVNATWPAVSTANLSHYEVAWQIGSGGWAVRKVDTNTATERGFLPGSAISAKVRSVSKDGVPSDYSQITSITAAASTTPPGQPTGFAVTSSFEGANLSWVNPTNKDLRGVEVWVGDTAAGGALFTEVAAPGTFFRYPMAGQSTKFFFLRSVNTSGLYSGFLGPIQITSPLLQAGQMAAGIVDATKLAASIAANTVVTALPTTKTTPFVTLGDHQYRWDSATGAYTKAVAAVDIAGKVAAAQIDSVTAAQISGQLQAAQVASLTAGQITGQMGDGQIASLSAAKVAGTLTQANIDTARLLGSITKTQITDGAISTPKLEAGAVTTSKLSVVSTNMAYNPDLAQGIRGWAAGGNMPGVDTLSSERQWAPTGHRTIFVRAVTTAAAAAGRYYDISSGPVDASDVRDLYFITANSIYEFSACISAHRCTGRVILAWFRADRSFIGHTDVGSRVSVALGQGTPYKDFPKTTLIAQAPADATFVQPFFRMDDVTGADPYLFISCFMMAASRPGVTETSPYVAPGVTTIDGGTLITRTITANRLVALSITADEIAANAITAGKILAGQIQTAHMTAGSINADRLVARSIVADRIALRTLQAENIATRTILAENIVANTITGNEILANSVHADRIVANTITAAQIAAGAIKTAQLDAAAVTADKIGVGLNTGNLIWNSDQVLAGWYGVAHNTDSGATTFNRETQWGVSGMFDVYVQNTGQPSNGRYAYIDLHYPNADGTRTPIIPVQGGQTYELSVYISAHRCRGEIQVHWFDGAGYPASSASNVIDNTGASGAPNDSWRARLKSTAPAQAKGALIRLYTTFTGGAQAYAFYSGMYFGLVPIGTPASVYSAYAPQARTLITGEGIATNSLHANKITAGTITSDHVQADSLDVSRINAESLRVRIVNTDGLQAAYVVVGSTRLNNWVSGADTTRINGGSIAANSIEARSLRIAARQINLVGITFEAERDGNGNLTNFFKWSPGHVLYQNVNGDPVAKEIPGGRVAMNNSYWYVWFDPRAANFGFAQDNWDNIYRDPEVVLVATVSSMTGISVLVGSTLIDGTRIQTLSIVADKIATNAIQARHISANQITGDKIVGGSIVAGHIAAGQITGDHLAVNSVYAKHIVAGHVTADKLNVGVGGKNLIPNSDFYAFPRGATIPGLGWASSQAGVTGSLRVCDLGYPWEPPGMNSLMLQINGNPAPNQIADIYLGKSSHINTYNRNFPVAGGQRYEFSTYVSAHRCRAQMIVQFYDGAGNFIDNSTLGTNINDQGAFGGQLSSWFRVTGFGYAPANASHALITLRMTFVGGDSPYSFWTGLYLGPATANQSEPSPWSNGAMTTIEGGSIRTRSITADRLDVGTITAASGVIGDLAITNAKIDNLTINGAKIADYALTTITAASSANRDTVTYISSRSPTSRFLILAFFNGNSNSGSNSGPGSFIIYRNGGAMTEVAASFALFKPDSGNIQYYLNAMCIGVIDQPGQGTVAYSCFHSNGQGVGGVTIVAMELAK